MTLAFVLKTIADDAAQGDMVFPTHVGLALAVQRLLADPDSSLDQLVALISAEPMLAAKAVGLANSVAYNPGGRPIIDVRGAVSCLGFRVMRILAMVLIVRQMRDMSPLPEHRALAARLWEHTAYVASLARVIARKITGQDPEAAFFAGIVHEVGGFYLLSRAVRFPDLLENDFSDWYGAGEAQVGRAVLAALAVPPETICALEGLWEGYLSMPPSTLGDTVLLADQLAPVESPLTERAGMGRQGMATEIDFRIDDETLTLILAESAGEVASLTAALLA